LLLFKLGCVLFGFVLANEFSLGSIFISLDTLVDSIQVGCSILLVLESDFVLLQLELFHGIIVLAVDSMLVFVGLDLLGLQLSSVSILFSIVLKSETFNLGRFSSKDLSSVLCTELDSERGIEASGDG
jgi:hypothetical protein